MARIVAAWEDFSGGEYGLLKPHQQAPNQFTATNMVVYDDGRVGPRTGLTALGETGLGAFDGNTVGFGYTDVAGARWLVYSNGQYYSYDDIDNDWNSAGGVALPPTGAKAYGVQASASTWYFLIPGHELSRVVANTQAAPTVTTGIGPSSWGSIGRAISFYRARLYVAENSNRIRYSAANDFTTTWASTNFFDVGDSSPIRYLGWSGDHLVIFKANMEIWTYTGIPGNFTLRRVAGGNTREYDLFQSRVVELPNGETVLIRSHRSHPGILRGTVFREIQHLKQPWYAPPVTGGSTEDDMDVSLTHEHDGVMLVLRDRNGNNNSMWWRRNGAWTKHTFDIDGEATNPEGLPLVATNMHGGAIIGADHGGGNGTVYNFQIALNRPSFTSDTSSQPGDNSDTTLVDADFTTSTYRPESGREFTPEKVIIDFVAYDTGSTTDNNLDVSIEGRNYLGEEASITVDSWTEAASSASTSGEPRRVVLQVPERLELVMAQVKLDNIRGVAIEAIRLVTEEEDSDAR